MRIGFTGPFCTANFGDWAMLVNNIYDFGLENEFIIFTYSCKFPHNAIMHYFSDISVSLIEVKIYNEDLCVEMPTPLDLFNTISNIDELQKIIKDLDLMVVSGGGWIDNTWCKRMPKFYKVMAPIIIATQIGIPVRFMAQGIGPIYGMEDTLRAFFNYLNNDTVFAIRDEYCSHVYLKALTGEKYQVKYLPDDLAIINSALVPTSSDELFNMKTPYIVMVINDSMEFIKNNLELFKSFFDIIKKKYNYSIVFLPFDLVWFGEDQAKMLSTLVEDSIVVDISQKKFIPIEDTYSIIKGAKLVLTGRHHAAVMAMNTHTPVILKLDSNRHFYAFNKAHGVFSMLTKNTPYDENLFVKNEWEEIFRVVESNCEDVIHSQSIVYEHAEYERNRENLNIMRRDYIKSILTI